MKRSIYSIIHENLRRMLIVTLSIAALFLLVYTVVSFKQAEKQAFSFVTSHIERLAKAEANSQNLNELDNEIARFAQTWKETEELDLRVDLFINGRPLSHAGQLQPFRYFVSSTEKDITLASGDKLHVEIQFDLTGYILFGLILLLAFESGIVGIFYILKKSMQTSIKSVTEPLESKIAWIKTIATDLPNSARQNTVFEPTNITEIDDLGQSIGTLTQQIVGLEDHLAKVNFDKGRLKMAEQVAHNIKGVIATLQLKVAALPLQSDTEKKELIACIDSLRDISTDLLKTKKGPTSKEDDNVTSSSVDLLPVLRTTISTKKNQYSTNAKVEIKITDSPKSIRYFANINSLDLQNVISNLIDNSIEAFDGAGTVELSISADSHATTISVKDNGKGIPSHIIPSLMKEGFSYGKPDGNGIGLSHAKEVIEAAGGKIEIKSAENVGTTVSLKLPSIAASRFGIAQSIQIPRNGQIICVDDDPVIHLVWDQRLKAVGVRIENIVHISSVGEFVEWMSANGHGAFGSRLYLFDYNLKDTKKTGLDLIEDYGLALESVLVSSVANDADVSRHANRINVKRVPKDDLHILKIEKNKSPEREPKALGVGGI